MTQRFDGHTFKGGITAAAKVIGGPELARKLKVLPDRVQTRVVRKAINKGATVILQAAKRNVPRRSRQLQRSLGRKVKSRKGRYAVVIGSRRGFKTVDDKGRAYNPTRVVHLVEKGTKAHSIPRPARGLLGRIALRRETSPHPGARPQPFLKPAFQQNRGAVMAAMKSQLGKEIEREAAKL